jgi:hypothetical protein
LPRHRLCADTDDEKNNYLDADIARVETPIDDNGFVAQQIDLVRPRTIQKINFDDDDTMSPLEKGPSFETKKRPKDLQKVIMSNLEAYDNTLKKSGFSPDR